MEFARPDGQTSLKLYALRLYALGGSPHTQLQSVVKVLNVPKIRPHRMIIEAQLDVRWKAKDAIRRHRADRGRPGGPSVQH